MLKESNILLTIMGTIFNSNAEIRFFIIHFLVKLCLIGWEAFVDNIFIPRNVGGEN